MNTLTDISETVRTVTLTLAELETMLREPVRDKRYLDTRLGPSVKAYLSWKENEVGAADRTIDQYERDLARMCAMLADHTIDDVTTDDLREVRDSFPKKSRRRASAPLRDFWRWLYEEGRIETDPAARMRNPKTEPPQVQDVFSDVEEQRLITAQTAIRDMLGVALLLDAGPRAAEIRGLRVEDVNLAERRVIVRRGKGGKSRVVPIRGRAVRLFEEFLLTPIPKLDRVPRREDFVLYPTGAGPYGPTWSDPTRPMAYSSFWRWWNRCVERAGVRYRRPHMSRHSYGTKLARASGNLAAVQKALGHASIRTTVDTYVHLALDDVAEAVEAMDELRRRREKVSAQAEEKALQTEGREAPSGFEPLYEALQASA
jgi:site-specific recombinase XerD